MSLTHVANKVLNRAQQVAEQHQYRSVAPAHLLIALVEERSCVAAVVMAQHGIDLDLLHMQTKEQLPSPSDEAAEKAFAEQVLIHAFREARDGGRGYDAGTEHLLLGLLLVPKSAAAQPLHRAGLEPEKWRTWIKEARLEGTEPRAALDETRPLEEWQLMLRSSDRDERLNAVFNLEKMPARASECVPTLIEALSDPDSAVRAGATRTLATLGREAKRAVPTLARLLNDADPGLRFMAAHAIEKIGWNPIDLPPEVQELAFVRVALARQTWNRDRRAKASLPTFVLALSDGEPFVRRAAAGAIRELGAQAAEAVPQLIIACQDGCHLVRMNVIMALSAIGPAAAPAAPALLKARRDSNSTVRLFASGALEKLGPACRAIVGDLSANLADPDPQMRGWAARVLASVGPAAERAIPALQDMLSDPEMDVRVGAAWALWKIAQRTDTLPLLIEAVRHDVTAAILATRALAEMGPAARSAVAALDAVLASSPCKHRLAAAYALWRIENRETMLRILIEGLEDPDSFVRGMAAHYLGQVGSVAKPAVPALRRAWLKEKDLQGILDLDARRSAYLEAVRKIDPPTAERDPFVGGVEPRQR